MFPILIKTYRDAQYQMPFVVQIYSQSILLSIQFGFDFVCQDIGASVVECFFFRNLTAAEKGLYAFLWNLMALYK